jgi:hypothetical protein
MNLDRVDSLVAHDPSLLADCDVSGPLQDEVKRALRFKAQQKSHRDQKMGSNGNRIVASTLSDNVETDGMETNESDRRDEAEQTRVICLDLSGTASDDPTLSHYQPTDLIKYTPEAEQDIARRTRIIIEHGTPHDTTKAASFLSVVLARLNDSQLARFHAEQNKDDVWKALQYDRPHLFHGRAGYVSNSKRKSKRKREHEVE